MEHEDYLVAEGTARMTPPILYQVRHGPPSVIFDTVHFTSLISNSRTARDYNRIYAYFANCMELSLFKHILSLSHFLAAIH